VIALRLNAEIVSFRWLESVCPSGARPATWRWGLSDCGCLLRLALPQFEMPEWVLMLLAGGFLSIWGFLPRRKFQRWRPEG